MTNTEDFESDLNTLPNKKYETFFLKAKELDLLKVKDWKLQHVLFYFVDKYKKQYNTDYKFKFNNPAPSKCFEVFQIKRLSLNLSSDPEILKNYIDWVFINKIIKLNKRITSISYLTNEDNMKEFKLELLTGSSLDRNSILPNNVKILFSNFSIETYGDLAFLKNSELSQELNMLFSKLEDCDFDINILDKIK